jgi:hypothetical protein
VGFGCASDGVGASEKAEVTVIWTNGLRLGSGCESVGRWVENAGEPNPRIDVAYFYYFSGSRRTH